MTLPPRSDSPVGELHATYRSPRMRAKLVTAALVLDLAALLVVGLLLWDSLGIASALEAGEEVAAGSFDRLHQRASEIEMISWALVIVCAVAFCLWTYRVAVNATALGGRLAISPGSAVGYYFIPIINWWMPYSALAQVWDASDPDPRAEQWARRSHGLLLAWWIAWLGSGIVDLFALRWQMPDTADWSTHIMVSYVSLAAEAIAAVLAIAVVWKLTRRQEARAAAILPTARVA